jgi:hypothetical protein
MIQNRRKRAEMHLAMRRVTARLIVRHRKRAAIDALISENPTFFLRDLQVFVDGRQVLVPRNRLTRARARRLFSWPHINLVED